MRYLSVCSGIEAATVAWHPLGWEPAAFSEIEAAPRAILAHHYPHVPIHGDFTTIRGDEYGAIDLLVGGTPCQSFSIAGLRGGLADDRGNLALEFLKLAGRTGARWVVWENVPGVFSALSHDAPDFRPPDIDLDAGDGPEDGEEIVVEDRYDADEDHAFACFLAGLQELGYGLAYRVLDAQYAGVPQRRRRVFVVGYLGDWRRAAAVLFERHSLSGHPAPRREAGQGVAGSITAGARKCDHAGSAAGGLIASTGSVAHCLNAGGMGRQDYETETLIAHALRGEDFDASEDGTGRGTPLVPVAFAHQGGGTQTRLRWDPDSGTAPTLSSNQTPAIAFKSGAGSKAGSIAAAEEMAPTLQAAGAGNHRAPDILKNGAVRRLTPRECERLQGFPDDYTLVPYRKGMMADGPRYKALGNSMAVPVMRWIGERIARVEALGAELAA